MGTPVYPQGRSAGYGDRRQRERPIGSTCHGCRHPAGRQAHCSVCHCTFGAVSGFDRHRRDGWCIEPDLLGMVCRDGIWRRPMAATVVRTVRGSGHA